MNTQLKSARGFSLVELMVVVAIIGILAVMSVGAVQKQIAKARQAEAKTSLASLYTAEKSFNAEYNCYWTGFTTIGFSLEGDLRYDVGFQGASNGVSNLSTECGYNGTSTSATPSTAAAICTGSPQPCRLLGNGIAAPVGSGNATRTTFVAEASSMIYKEDEDRWTINQNKELRQTADGLDDQ